MAQNLFIQSAPNGRKIFIQPGFWETVRPNDRLHKHNYTEIHLVSGGRCRFCVEERVIDLCDGDLLLIPKKTLHCCTEQDACVRHTAFQMDTKDCEIEIHSLPCGLVLEFFRQIPEIEKHDNYGVISTFISLFYSFLKKDTEAVATPITDDGFLVQEFFFHRYAEDVQLSDLASLLHRSERQTERLVLACTGHTFREELARTRIEIARRLMESTSLSLQSISEYVGYRSYAGFWKALKKYG